MIKMEMRLKIQKLNNYFGGMEHKVKKQGSMLVVNN